ncbi:MAG: hypothetical protein HZB26_21675 [Candidatus Hydrogenedentes bacterium]|nr:hypothetical protein [Candidatus Hydrogenedentota bacterium]
MALFVGLSVLGVSSCLPAEAASPQPAPAAATVTFGEDGNDLFIKWQGDESIGFRIAKNKGVFSSPIRVTVGDKALDFGGFYAQFNKLQDGLTSELTRCAIEDNRVRVVHTLRHSSLPSPVTITFTLWMESQDRALRIEVETAGDGAHLDRLGLGDHHGAGLAAKRMFFGRMYVLDEPKAFEVEHNYNTCKFWCWTMANGLTELQATDGPAKGFRYEPEAGRYDLFTYCESPIRYKLLFTGKSPQDAIAEYRNTVTIPAPPTLSQLPGRVGVMTAYPIMERYEDFLEEFTGRGARDFVWLSYCPTPGDRQRVEKYGAIYATYDTYLDIFKEGIRGAEGWTPEMVQYRDNGKMVRGYWSSTWLLPDLYVKMATTRVMGVFGREYRNDSGENDFIKTPATRFSNLAITKEEVGPNGLYLDVHASKATHHFYDYQHNHHPAHEHLQGERKLFDFAREYLGNVPIWSEGGGEDYAGIMDGGWFMDWRPPDELGIRSAKWQYYPFIDQIHRERMLNMSIYYPLDHYDPDMVNAAILFGRPQAISVYSGTPQDDVSGRMQVYYMTKAFHKMLGLSRMERTDFADDDIDRCIVSYSNGARVWSNRSKMTWDIEGYTLPPLGYLVKGPNDFLEYRATKNGETVDVVQSNDYEYFSSPKSMNFGPVTTSGAIAITTQPDRITIYEIKKPGGLELHLGAIRGTHIGQEAIQEFAVLTRGRKIEIPFPDFRQPFDSSQNGELGNLIRVGTVEMREVVRYEVLIKSKS